MGSYPERVRQRENLRPAVVLQEITGSIPVFTSTGFRVLGSKKVTLDNIPKRWRPGDFSLNPAEFRSFEASSTAGSLVQKSSPYTSFKTVKWSGEIAGLGATPVIDVSSATPVDANYGNSAIARAYAAVSQPDADVGLMLAEAAQTVSMIVSPARTFAAWYNKGWRNLSRTIKRQPQSVLSALSDYWLATRFGILPTIADINSLVKKCHKGLSRDLHVLRRRSGGVGFGLTQTETLTEEPWGVFTTRWRNSVITSQSVNCQVYFNEHLIMDYGLGLSIYDLPNLVWELVPFSFVVDWMFDIGTWLRSMQPQPGVNFLGNCVSTKYTRTYTRTCRGARFVGQPWGYADITTNSMYLSSLRKMVRVINVPMPVAPVFNADFTSLTHAVDSVSLIWQRLPKFK